MADRSVRLNVTANVGGLVAGMKTGQKALADMAAGAKRFGPIATAESRAAKDAFIATGVAAHKAANDQGFLYDSNGKLKDAFGQVVSEAEATSLGLSQVSENARFASESADSVAESFDMAGDGLAIFGAVAVAGTTLAVTKFAEFDQAMSSVQAATHETAENMGFLRQAAIDAGADTAFSAGEAAAGIEELAKAGVSTTDVMSGGLAGALSLAAAGNLDVGDAAEIAASAMTQFKLSGDQIPHVADLLAAGAGKAQGSVQDLGAALNQSGLVAAATGLSIEETTGGLAAFASAGLVGSDAGTSFKTMLQRLTPQSDAAQTQFDELGISAYDAQGNFVGLTNFAGQLQTKMAKLTPEARNAAMSVMFGSDAVRASNVLYEQGAAGIQDWIGAVDDAGYAADTAAIMQNNLAGDIEKLGGAFDTVFIQSGGAANDMLRGLIQTAEGFIDAVGKIPAPVMGIGAVVGGIAGGAALLAGGLMTVIPKINTARDSLRTMAPAGSRARRGLMAARGGLVGVGKAAGIAAGAFILLQAAVAANNATAPKAKGVEQLVSDYNKVRDSAVSVNDTFKNLKFAEGSSLEGEIGNLGDALGQLAPKFGDVAGHLGSFGATVLGAENGLPQMKRQIEGLSDAMATAVEAGDFEGASKVFRDMVASAEEGGKGISDLTPYMSSYIEALRKLSNQSGANLSEQELLNWALSGTAPVAVTAAAGIDATTAAEEDAAEAAEAATKAVDDFYDALVNVGAIALSERDALRGLEESFDAAAEAAKDNGKTLDINTEKGRANQTALDGIADSTMSAVRSQEEAGRSAGEMAATMEKGRAAFIKQAEDLGMSTKAASALADELNLIPGEVFMNFETNADGVSQRVQELYDWIKKSPDGKIQIDDNSPEVRETLESLGFVIKDLPNGQIEVTEKGAAETGKKLDDTARKKRDAKITADAITKAAEEALALLARNRSMTVFTTYSTSGKVTGQGGEGAKSTPGRNVWKAKGGRIPYLEDGGRLPYTGLGRDMILGVNSQGRPTANVDDGEWVINEKSSSKYDGLLAAINRDDPRVNALKSMAGFAGGGQLSSPMLSVPPSREVRQHAAQAAGPNVSIKVDVHGATDGPAVARQVINEIGWKLNEQGLGVNL